MKKIKRKEEILKEKDRNQKIIVFVFGFLLIISTIGYAFKNMDDNDDLLQGKVVEEYGIKFVLVNDYWEMDYDSGKMYFRYLPSELINIDVEMNKSIIDYVNNVLYFSGDANTLLLGNIYSYVTRFQEVSLTPTDKDIPIKDCASNILVFEQSDSTRIYSIDNCVYITGDILKASDLFMFKILGVI